MKNFLFLLTAIFILLSVSSCEKDESEPSEESYFLSCKIDGENFDAFDDFIRARKYSDIIEISGPGFAKSILFVIPDTATRGSYSFSPEHSASYYFTDWAGSYTFCTNCGDGSGSVTIEFIDASRVKGTFQFIAYDANTGTVRKTITEGKFNVPFF